MLSTLISSINAAMDPVPFPIQLSRPARCATTQCENVTPSDTQATQTGKKSCEACIRKAQQLKALRIKSTKLLHKIANLQKSLRDNTEMIDLKVRVTWFKHILFG